GAPLSSLFPYPTLFRSKRRIGPVESKLLADHLGSDLGKLTNEVEKLCIVVEPGASITGELIERNVGISKDYNIFELQKAMGAREDRKSTRLNSSHVKIS